MLWCILHYGTSHIYTYYCTPTNILGFFASPLLAMSPVCKAVNWVRMVSIYTIENMWYVFGIWISSHMTGLFQGISKHIQS